jgi:hypothetical protein
VRHGYFDADLASLATIPALSPKRVVKRHEVADGLAVVPHHVVIVGRALCHQLVSGGRVRQNRIRTYGQQGRRYSTMHLRV